MRILNENDFWEAAEIIGAPECQEYITDDTKDTVKNLKNLAKRLTNPADYVTMIPVPGVLIQFENYIGDSVLCSIYARKWARRGLRNIIGQVKEYFWANAKVNNVVFLIREDNKPSIFRCYELGAKEVGRLEEAMVKNGKKYDCIIFQIKRGE